MDALSRLNPASGQQLPRSLVKTPRYRLSVIVIACNEADRLGRCLHSVAALADQIVVFDSGSSDDTVSLAKRYTDHVFSTDWPGYGPQKQRALAKATGDWVLSIDADEELDPQLQASLRSLLARPRGAVSAARLRVAATYYGERLYYGAHAGSTALRLVWRDGATVTAAPVHEKLIAPPGDTITLRGNLKHDSLRDFGHGLRKSARYAWLGSQRYYQQGRRCRSLWFALLRASWTFFRLYVLRGGFLDGPVGLLMAIGYAQTNFNKYAGLWTLTRAARRPHS